MQREMKKLIENQPLDKFCPICGITLSSPVVCLSHYIGKNHLKKAKNAEFSNQQDVIDRINKLGKFPISPQSICFTDCIAKTGSY